MASASNRWLVTATIMIGTLASVLASSTINVALTDIMNGLQTNLSVIDWVVTAYMLANVIAMPCTGWLGDVLGRRNLYVAGLLLFMSGSLLAGASWSIESLIAFRVLQGLGGGLMMPTAQAILFDTFPPDQRGTAMGIYGLGAILGPAFGPTVGGWLVEFFNWRSLFFINLPFAVTSLVMLLVLVPARPSAAGARRFDAWGFTWLVLTLGSLQMALGNGAKDGWDSPGIIGYFATAAIAGSLLLLREFTVDDPLIDFTVFANRGYLMGSIVSTALGLGLFGSTFLLPLFLGSVLGYTALQIGVLMIAGSLTMGVMMLIGGRLSDRIDARWLIGSGM
ncbi:MAG TPA: DHA2 family efflux MFS transporter permease subunit, partial [Stenomitos sp.]